MSKLKLTAADISSLAAVPFLTSQLIDWLKSEVSEYLTATEDVSDNLVVLKWWKTHEENDRLANWTHACKIIVYF